MRRSLVIPAAVIAAVFVFGIAPPGAAEPSGGGTHASSSSKAGAKKTSKKEKKKSVRRSAKKKKATKVIRQNPSGVVVLEAVAVETAAFYGPFLPLEAHDYPPAPCPPSEPVVVAQVHEVDEATPEPEDVTLSLPAQEPDPLSRVAKTLGSLLRPKSSAATLRPEDVDLSDLLQAGVQIPVEGVDASRLRDSFLSSRGRHRKHLAIDIGAPKGTPILAATDGEVVKLARERRGGISVYQKDATGRYLFYYCHLSKYAPGLSVGDRITGGDVIGYVGRTGRVIGGSHLHFSITRLAADDDNHKAGVAVNPYLLFLATVP